jgi:hypothetical protein
LINTKVKKIGLKLYFLCQNRLTFLIRNKNVIKTNGYSIISQRILDKKILIFCSKNSNFVIQNLNLVEISGLSINSFQTFAKNHSISKTILLTLADIMHVKSMQYCWHLSRNVNNTALENVDVTTYILHPFAMLILQIKFISRTLWLLRRRHDLFSFISPMQGAI